MCTVTTVRNVRVVVQHQTIFDMIVHCVGAGLLYMKDSAVA